MDFNVLHDKHVLQARVHAAEAIAPFFLLAYKYLSAFVLITISR